MEEMNLCIFPPLTVLTGAWGKQRWFIVSVLPQTHFQGKSNSSNSEIMLPQTHFQYLQFFWPQFTFRMSITCISILSHYLSIALYNRHPFIRNFSKAQLNLCWLGLRTGPMHTRLAHDSLSCLQLNLYQVTYLYESTMLSLFGQVS